MTQLLFPLPSLALLLSLSLSLSLPLSLSFSLSLSLFFECQQTPLLAYCCPFKEAGSSICSSRMQQQKLKQQECANSTTSVSDCCCFTMLHHRPIANSGEGNNKLALLDCIPLGTNTKHAFQSFQYILLKGSFSRITFASLSKFRIFGKCHSGQLISICTLTGPHEELFPKQLVILWPRNKL
jgi:hypothetical protein